VTEASILAELTDRLEIRELTARYNRASDTGDGEGFAATFTADGALVMAGKTLCTGSAELVAFAGKPRGTVHATTDPVLSLNGDEATQECTLLLFRKARDGSSVRLENTGRYEDELVRTQDGWRFRRRSVLFDANPPGTSAATTA
jgi:hypothetical protein